MLTGTLQQHILRSTHTCTYPHIPKAVFYGEYLEQAEGEDVVSGVRTPHSLAWLQNNYPEIYDELNKYQKQLENHYRDMQART